MKITTINLVLAVALIISILFPPRAHACTSAPTPVSPSSTFRSFQGGDAAATYTITVSIQCTAGETYSLSMASSAAGYVTNGYGMFVLMYNSASSLATYTSSTATSIIGAPLTGTATATGVVNLTLFGVTEGGGGGGACGSCFNLSALGLYSVAVPIIVASSGGATFTTTYTETGIVGGTCAVGSPTVSFGTVASGTTNPLQSVALTMNCTSGLPLSISQPSVAYVTIGTVTTNTAWIYSDAGATVPIQTTPITATATGSSQSITAYVGLSGATRGAAIQGTGAISGTVNYVVTY